MSRTMLSHELAILQLVRDDPGCATMLEHFEDEQCFYVVLEDFVTGYTDVQSILCG